MLLQNCAHDVQWQNKFLGKPSEERETLCQHYSREPEKCCLLNLNWLLLMARFIFQWALRQQRCAYMTPPHWAELLLMIITCLLSVSCQNQRLVGFTATHGHEMFHLITVVLMENSEAHQTGQNDFGGGVLSMVLKLTTRSNNLF